MDNYYVACELGEERGRVMLGCLHKGKLSVCEIRKFDNAPLRQKESIHWNVPQLYHEVIAGLRGVGAHEEPVESVSCFSWGSDYMLFEADGTLITPTYHGSDPRTEAGVREVFSKLTPEVIYDETGSHAPAHATLFQVAAEKPKRLRNHQLLTMADGFNFLLSGVPRLEMSIASSTCLCSPATRAWSTRLLQALDLPPNVFPQIVAGGTRLGMMRPEIASEIGFEDAQVVAACSDASASALAGLPVQKGEMWAYLQTGSMATLGTQLISPLINDVTREWSFSNTLGYGGAINFSKQLPGLWILEDCRQFWKEKDRELDYELLMHIATASEPFESLINLSDPRFQTPGDMPLKIQAFCRETGQTAPRKPGHVARCVLESLALLYRKSLHELECLTGRQFSQLYVLGSGNSLLNHFTANALRIPVCIASADAPAIGNVVIQALALRHIGSLEEARDIVRGSFRTETIVPHAAAWDVAYNRLAQLTPAAA